MMERADRYRTGGRPVPAPEEKQRSGEQIEATVQDGQGAVRALLVVDL